MHPLKPLDNKLIRSSANFIKEHKYKIIAAIAAIVLVVFAFTPPGAILAAAISTGILGALIVKGGAFAIGATIIGISFLFQTPTKKEETSNADEEKTNKAAEHQAKLDALEISRKNAREAINEAEKTVVDSKVKKFEEELHTLVQEAHYRSLLNRSFLTDNYRTEKDEAVEDEGPFFKDVDLEIEFEDDYQKKVKNPPKIVPVPAAPVLKQETRRVVSPTTATIVRTPEERQKAYDAFRAELILKKENEAANRTPEEIKEYNPKVHIEERFSELTTPPKPPRVKPTSSSLSH